jgi:hypothetical protein
MNTTRELEQPDFRNLVASTAPALAIADAATVALIHLELTCFQLGRLGIQGIEDHLAQLDASKNSLICA